MKKQVLVTVDRGETRVAMLEAAGEVTAARKSRRRKKGGLPTGYRVAEVYFERRGGRSIVGNIYKGKVDNVLPGLEAAFVDFGLEKNGFLHVDEIVLPGVEQVKRGRGKESGPRITDLLRPGQEIVVQVIKDPLKTKGARLTMELTIAGRYMVYAPTGEGVGVSRRLDDAERTRLRTEVKGLDLGGGGAIVRTAAHGATRAGLRARARLPLQAQRGAAEARRGGRRRPRSSSRRPTSRSASCATSSPRTSSARSSTTPSSTSGSSRSSPAPRPSWSTAWSCGRSRHNLFEANGVDTVIEGMISRRVDLPSGGYLIIDYAEALTVIDINTGSYTGKGKAARLEDTITRTNLEAAEEVVNQLRLRDIGGIIVIDFIDMARARNRDAVLKVLRKALDEDRTKTFVVEISPLGLVEMTRQNVTDGAREIMTKPCPVCGGEGVVKSEETIAIEFERHLRELAAMKRRGRARGLPRPHEPEGHRLLHGRRRADAPRAGGGDRPLVPLHRLRGAAARPLRDRRGGRARADRGAERPVPRGRGGARRHRRAAHVLRGRRGRQGRRLPDRGQGRDRLRRREDARADRAGGPHRRDRGARRGGGGGRRGDRGAAQGARARREAARRPRGARKKPAAPAPPTPEDEAVETLADDDSRVHAGTGPAAVAEADEDAAAPRGRRRGVASPKASARSERRAGGADVEERRGATARRRRPTRRRRGIIEASAPRPQRRTAPFACEADGDAAEVSEASE